VRGDGNTLVEICIKTKKKKQSKENEARNQKDKVSTANILLNSIIKDD